MQHQDRTMTCKECGGEFIFTAGEQDFYAQKGFENDPSRCPDCRNQRKKQFRKHRGGSGSSSRKQLFDDVCDACKKPTQVPFQRTGSKPVYCKECFEKVNAGSF